MPVLVTSLYFPQLAHQSRQLPHDSFALGVFAVKGDGVKLFRRVLMSAPHPSAFAQLPGYLCTLVSREIFQLQPVQQILRQSFLLFHQREVCFVCLAGLV